MLNPFAHLQRLFSLNFVAVIAATCSLGLFVCAFGAYAENEKPLDPRDDGSQINNLFRINYAGYLPQQEKIAVYLSADKGAKKWQLLNNTGRVVAKGKSRDRRVGDYASGDSFFLIDFSRYQIEGDNYSLRIDGKTSPSFSISNDPYGQLKYEFFDYFKDHRRAGDKFDRAVNNWSTHSVTLDFIADAGDQGYYTVNAAEAQWSLINLLETYPEVNTYYSRNSLGMATVYNELRYFSRAMEKTIFPGETLAVAKFATFSNTTWGRCPGAAGDSGPCISLPETKATYAVARTLAAMARLHANFGNHDEQQKHYQLAKTALRNAEKQDPVCLDWTAFGGEGGYYPNNDNYGLWRDPRSHRDPCASGSADPKDNNLNDDHYAALVELYIAADKLGLKADKQVLQQQVETHPHHLRVDKFFFGAVSTEATLSLLSNRPAGMDLTGAEQAVFAYADNVRDYQKVGYPGVTFDVKSDEWKTGDKDDMDANFRWGSNRMQLNDARIVMAAAELAFAQNKFKLAAAYTNAVLRVLDQISGTNAVALAMYTSDDYPHIEHAVTRTHDGLVADTENGKMVLGANNWTNANDPFMPAFGSMPGMKMFALTGTGWSSREIAIDANAALVPVAYFATEVAPKILAAAHYNQ